MELLIFLAILNSILLIFVIVLLFGITNMLLKMADKLDQTEEADEQLEDAGVIPEDLLAYNPYQSAPVGKLEKTK